MHGGSNDRRNLIESIGAQATSIAGSIETAFPNAVSEIQGAVSTAVDSLETVVPEIVSHVQSAANAIATAIPAAIEEILPRNCSIGTTQYCIGRAENVSCHDLPPKILDILPAEIQETLGDKINGVPIVDAALANITTQSIQTTWIVGLLFMFLLVTTSLLSVFGYFFRLKLWRVMFHMMGGLIVCIPFLVPVVVLHVLRSKLNSLPSWIQVSQGDFTGLLIAGLSCMFIFLAFCVALSAVL